MFESFASIPFFRRPEDKVYLVRVETIDNDGFLERVKSAPQLIDKKIIQPIETKKVEGRTLVKKAVIWINFELNFFNSSNGSDYIIWKNNYYRVVDILDRVDNNGYGYRYKLEYLNEDDV